MELVTLPMITNAKQAMNFGKELQLLLRTLAVGHANLEKGEMRIEANVSISEEGNWEMLDKDFSKLGTKTEMKNLGSFKVVGAAIDYEVQRQIEVIESGEKVVQSTRGWDDNKGETFFQRNKENSDDYRYFPEPDIPKFKISEIPEFSRKNLIANFPELPWIKRERFLNEYKIKSEDVEFYLQNPEFGNLFNDSAEKLKSEKEWKLLSNYLSTDLAGFEKGNDIKGGMENILAESMVDLIKMISNGDLSSRGAKDTLTIMYSEGGKANEIAEKNNFIQKSDVEELKKITLDIIEKNPKQAEQYKGGNEKLLMYFVGQGMKITKGSANPGVLSKLFKELL